MRVNIEPGTLRIASSNAEQEEAMEELEIDYGGDAIEIGFNVTYLIDALANMGQEMVKLELQDTNSSALITVPEQRRLQVRRDADADLSDAQADTARGRRPACRRYQRPASRFRGSPEIVGTAAMTKAS